MIENSFENCFLNLRVDDRIEALVLNVLDGQSKLETLRDSYQTGIRSHGKCILAVLSVKNEDDKTEILQAHLQNLQEQVESMENTIDINELEISWVTLNESYEDFKNDDSKPSEQEIQLQAVRKKTSKFVGEAQVKLEEYCQRIMIQAEEHRACKFSFDDNLASEVRMIKQNFTESLKNLFQKRRVEKLRVLVEEFDLVNMEKCNVRVEAYQESIRKRKILMRRVFEAEKQLRACQFKLRKVPYIHFESIAEASKTISTSTTKLISMGNMYSQLNDSQKSDMEFSKRQKVILDKKLADLLKSTTKLQIELCDVIKKAIRQQVYKHEDLCCLTPDDFDACERQ